MEDFLVYEVSKYDSPYVGFGCTRDPARVMEENPDSYFRPLFGFFGTREDCEAKVSEYIKSLDLFINRENFLTVYLISCLDPLVKETYVGKSKNFKTRVNGHIDNSCIKGTKVYEFIRTHGWWNNWTMKPLGEYLCDGDDGCRLEWFWWKKTKSILNTQTPGKKVVDRDKRKLKVKENELFHLYETFERVIHREYTGSEEPQVFPQDNVVFLDCAPRKKTDEYKRFTKECVTYRILNESDTESDYETEEEQIAEFPEIDVTGKLFLVTNGSESYIGFTFDFRVNERTVLKTMHKTRQGKLAYLYMTMKGGWSSWKIRTLSEDCDVKVYTMLSSYLLLNNLTHDHPHLKSFTYTHVNGDGTNQDVSVPLEV
jgi:GIY-YIG catalytic domain